MPARIVPIISISSVPEDKENDKVLDLSSFDSPNSISSPSDKMKKSSSIVPIFASKKSRSKVIDTSPLEPETSVSKSNEIKSRSGIADFRITLFDE